MCDICRREPCLSRCPNSDDPPIIARCDKCEGTIRVGDKCLKYDGITLCEDCISDLTTHCEYE